MNLSTQTSAFRDVFGEKQAIAMLASCGYDALDLSCFDMFRDGENCPKNKPDYLAYAHELRAIADDAGVYFNQAHAPFPSSLPDEARTAEIYQMILRSMEIASILGVRNIVVHPKQHVKYKDNEAYLKDQNLEFYQSLIPYARDLNVCVAMENMWQYDENRVITPSTCGRLTEFKEYLDMLDSPWINACLDVGHAFLVNENIPAFIHGLAPRLKALHVHDTGYNVDLHRLPYSAGGVQWEEVLQALAESGYDGELTFEADNTLVRQPRALMLATAQYMEHVGRYMTRRVEFYRDQRG